MMNNVSQEAGYYQGFIDSMLYRQVDLDTEANHDDPVLHQRIPKEFFSHIEGDYVPFDFDDFLDVLRYLDVCGIVYINAEEPNEYGERIIHVAGTEGYKGVPADFVANAYPKG
jgi:hypothetical protein